MNERKLSQGILMELLHYNPDTGVFVWKKRPTKYSNVEIGKRAGSGNSGPYRAIKIYGKRYLEHRLVWLYIYGSFPKNDIDHKNLLKKDNRLANLRLATDSQNHQNTKPSKRNTSGAKGVYWCKHRKRWVAKIRVPNTKWSKPLGRFKNIDDARRAYDDATQKYFGEFARPNEGISQ